MDTLNLLSIPDRVSNATRALWATRISGENDAPEERIIHSRCLQSDEPFQIDRIGIRIGVGFMKCGSEESKDWIRSFRLLTLRDDNCWHEILCVDDVPCPTESETIRYYELDHQKYSVLLVEIRRAGIDNWWPSWNLAMDGFILEGTVPNQKAKIFPSHFERLVLNESSLDGLPVGVSATLYDSEVRFRNDQHEIGFSLVRTGFSYFAIKRNPKDTLTQNLLQYPTLDNWSIQHLSPHGNVWRRNMDLTQGLHLFPYGSHETAGHYQQNYEGTVSVKGNRVMYHISVPSLRQTYQITWTIEKERLILDAERTGEVDVRLWSSGIWSMSLSSRHAATTVVGQLNQIGQASTLQFPIRFHAPSYGTLQVNLEGGEGLWRFDSIRPVYSNTHEIKCGEIPQPEGDYLLPAGKHTLKLSFTTFDTALKPIRKDTPQIVEQAVNRYLFTGLTFRPDLATLSNNGNSTHAPTCMEHWCALMLSINQVKPEWHVSELIRLSLERWLLDGTGYSSGRSFFHDGYIEDEYVFAGTSSALALALYIRHLADESWLRTHQAQIYKQLHLLHARDRDGDGLLEGRTDRRLGISGEYDWSTNWYDIISFGWKDAFSNAPLYQALCILHEEQPRFLDESRKIDFKSWAERHKKSYFEQFYNEKTGWFAGWRCKKDELHDYAFLMVNGAASVFGLLDDQPELHRSIIERLYREMDRVGFRASLYGLPANLWNIPSEDTSAMSHHRPFGCYQNGGVTLSQARFFVSAMYRVGLTQEADQLLESFCQGLMDGLSIAGCGSGIDWRMWDGSPSGYEGLLTDQLGVMIPILERYYK